MQGAEKGAQRRALATFHRAVGPFEVAGAALQGIVYRFDHTWVIQLVEEVHSEQLLLAKPQNRQAHCVAINDSSATIEVEYTQRSMTEDGTVTCLADT